MDFEFAGPTNLAYVETPHPVAALPYVTGVNPSGGENCALCLRTALGCGSQPSLEALENCQAVQAETKSVLFKDCTLQSRTFSSLPASTAGAECSTLCALDPPLEYGEGYTRPYKEVQRPGTTRRGL